jgi:nitrite reductase/ring-hydroxylating ferredoxin subunit
VPHLASERARSVDDANAIANGSVAPYYMDDRKLRVAIARVDDRLYAFDVCARAPTSAVHFPGACSPAQTIMCQCHGWRFDISTGAVTASPSDKPLTVYAVQEVDNTIQIHV